MSKTARDVLGGPLPSSTRKNSTRSMPPATSSLTKSFDQLDLTEHTSRFSDTSTIETDNTEDVFGQLDFVSPYLHNPETQIECLRLRLGMLWQWMLCVCVATFDLELGPRKHSSLMTRFLKTNIFIRN